MQTAPTVFQIRKAPTSYTLLQKYSRPARTPQSTPIGFKAQKTVSFLTDKQKQIQDNDRLEEDVPSQTQTNVYFCKENLFQNGYHRSLSQYLSPSTQTVRLFCLYRLASAYQSLTRCYGLFLLKNEHIRIDFNGKMAIWIEVPSQGQNVSQVKAVQAFLELSRKHMSERMGRMASVSTLEGLVLFFQRMYKRSQIHKKCQRVILERTEVKRSVFQRRTTSNPSVVRQYTKYPQSSATSIVSSYPFELWEHSNSFGNSTRPTSFRQQGGFQRMREQGERLTERHRVEETEFVRKKSNTVGCLDKQNREGATVRSGASKDTPLKEAPPNRFIESAGQCRRNSLEASFKQLFLSQISEDPQSDFYDSKKNFDEFVQDFRNVFY